MKDRKATAHRSTRLADLPHGEPDHGFKSVSDQQRERELRIIELLEQIANNTRPPKEPEQVNHDPLHYQ